MWHELSKNKEKFNKLLKKVEMVNRIGGMRRHEEILLLVEKIRKDW